MGKSSNWAERTDQGSAENADRTIVGPAPTAPGHDDEIEELAPEEALGNPGGPVFLGGGGAPPPADKTVVAAVPPPPPAPAANAEKTMIMQAPTAPEGGEATVITANPLAAGGRKPLRGKLVVTEGKEVGRVIELHDGTKVVGRSRDCDVILLDIQVSRQHAQLQADHNGVLVRDLGSGNGTQVNGGDVTEVRLVHGDEVRIGDHILRFEEEGPVAQVLAGAGGRGGVPAVPTSAAPPAPVPGGGLAPAGLPSVAARRAKRRGPDAKKKKLIVFASIGAGLILVMGVAKLMIPEPPPEPVGPTPEQIAQEQFAEGLAVFKTENYKEALGKFEAAAAGAPANEEIARYLAAAKREVQAGDALERAESALSREDWEEARRAYESVDPESLRISEATEGLRRVDEGHARALTDKGDRILYETEDLKIPDCEDAKSHYQEALAVKSDFQPALTGLRKADEKIDEINQRRHESAAARKRRLARERAAAARRAKQARLNALNNCAKVFDAGNFRKAEGCFADLARTADDGRLRKQAQGRVTALKKFPAAYDRGMGAAQARQSGDAIRYLGIAETGARKVSKGGPVHQKINKELADMHYLEGRVAFNGKNYAKAFQHWNAANRALPSHKYANDGLADLEKIAHELYLDAYIKSKGINKAQAVKQFKQVVGMTRPGFKDHGKAKERLADLGESY